MAYDRNNDKKPSFPIGEFTGEGNMVEDPKELPSSGDSAFIGFKVAFNSRNYKEYEGSFFVGCTASGPTAERILADGRKGKQVFITGDLFVDEPWENKDGDLVPSYSMKVRKIGESWKWPEKNSGGGSSSRRSRDDDDEPRGRSGRSSRGSSDDDEPRGRSGRSSRSSRDEEPADEPRGRSGRSSRGSSDDEPRGRTRRSSRGEVSNHGDDVDD